VSYFITNSYIFIAFSGGFRIFRMIVAYFLKKKHFNELSSFIMATGSNTVIYSKNIHSKKHKKAAYRNNTIYKIKV